MTTKEKYREFLKSEFWRDLSREKIRQVGGMCERCGARPGERVLQAHHDIYRKDWYDTRFEDLTVLCRGCHLIREDIALKEKVQEQVRHEFNPWYPENATPKCKLKEGENLKSWIRRQVESDRLTLQDKQVARDKGWIRG